ncbi:hypothetical protein TSACC_21159 [Terrimicrobium sacchariphilum]|uniref:Outer membrane lipoprotein-sorting protein n=1 Tax=Terrimicrobium sacchariphilum TaxID=690879 RepID=A0A146G7R1_TERSA|nr:hypothetical protein [Terrimicrobium sacchariphilum]GAT32758.1 hypothetical protein TSACC_21159 [Terrimicrobium sacchariphilum]
MKLCFAVLPALICSAALLPAAPKSIEDYRATFQQAVTQKDKALLQELIYAEGLSDEDKALAARSTEMFVSGPGVVESVTVVPVPNSLNKVRIARGKKWEPSLPPAGALLIKMKSPDGKSETTYTSVFGESGGEYYLVAAKSTKLDWNGPEDKTLNFIVMGKGQNAVKIAYRWNVSGVNMEEVADSPSISFLGQYIESMTVTSDSDDTDVTLSIREGGKEIYTSQPLKGKGTLEYKRP